MHYYILLESFLLMNNIAVFWLYYAGREQSLVVKHVTLQKEPSDLRALQHKTTIAKYLIIIYKHSKIIQFAAYPPIEFYYNNQCFLF